MGGCGLGVCSELGHMFKRDVTARAGKITTGRQYRRELHRKGCYIGDAGYGVQASWVRAERSLATVFLEPCFNPTFDVSVHFTLKNKGGRCYSVR